MSFHVSGLWSIHHLLIFWKPVCLQWRYWKSWSNSMMENLHPILGYTFQKHQPGLPCDPTHFMSLKNWLHHYHTWSHSISRSHTFKSFSHLFSNSYPNLASLILPLWSELSHAGSARRFMVGNPSAKSNLDKKSWAEKLLRVQLLQLLVHLFSMCLKSHCILLACRGLTIPG